MQVQNPPDFLNRGWQIQACVWSLDDELRLNVIHMGAFVGDYAVLPSIPRIAITHDGNDGVSLDLRRDGNRRHGEQTGILRRHAVQAGWYLVAWQELAHLGSFREAQQLRPLRSQRARQRDKFLSQSPCKAAREVAAVVRRRDEHDTLHERQ